MLFWTVVGLIGVALFFDYINGFHDAANSIATVVSTRVLSPGKANVGIIPGEVFRAGTIGLVSRSGTLTYQIGHELAQAGLGNSSIVGDLIGIRGGDYLITEAGFGADMGAERFFNIKCRVSGFKPAAAVVVATLRALKLHGGGGVAKVGAPLPPGLTGPNQSALEKGFANLEQHIANARAHGIPVVVLSSLWKVKP